MSYWQILIDLFIYLIPDKSTRVLDNISSVTKRSARPCFSGLNAEHYKGVQGNINQG